MKIVSVLSLLSILAISFSMGHLSVFAQDNMTSVENQTGGTNATGTANMTEGVSVSIVTNAAVLGDKAYDPNPAEVKVGQPVTWTNDDTQIHTATSGSVGAADSGSVFDSGILTPGASFEFTFDQSGEYDYYCTLHPQMFGQVVVSE